MPIARRILLSCSDVLFGFFMVLLYSEVVPLVWLVVLFFCFKGSHHLHTPHNPYQTYYIINGFEVSCIKPGLSFSPTPFGGPAPYIGGLGELVRLVRSPVTGRSISYRLRFRCVPCVRARRSCAGACRPLSLSLGLPGARIDVFGPVLFSLIFCAQAHGF